MHFLCEITKNVQVQSYQIDLNLMRFFSYLQSAISVMEKNHQTLSNRRMETIWRFLFWTRKRHHLTVTDWHCFAQNPLMQKCRPTQAVRIYVSWLCRSVQYLYQSSIGLLHMRVRRSGTYLSVQAARRHFKKSEKNEAKQRRSYCIKNVD